MLCSEQIHLDPHAGATLQKQTIRCENTHRHTTCTVLFLSNCHNAKASSEFFSAVSIKTKNWIIFFAKTKLPQSSGPRYGPHFLCPSSLYSWYLHTMHLHWPSVKQGCVKFSFPLSIFISLARLLFWSCLEYRISDPPSLSPRPWI